MFQKDQEERISGCNNRQRIQRRKEWRLNHPYTRMKAQKRDRAEYPCL